MRCMFLYMLCKTEKFLIFAEHTCVICSFHQLPWFVPHGFSAMCFHTLPYSVYAYLHFMYNTVMGDSYLQTISSVEIPAYSILTIPTTRTGTNTSSASCVYELHGNEILITQNPKLVMLLAVQLKTKPYQIMCQSHLSIFQMKKYSWQNTLLLHLFRLTLYIRVNKIFLSLRISQIIIEKENRVPC